MAYPHGISFRYNDNYVSNPTDCNSDDTYDSGYPRTSNQGNTVGGESRTGLNQRDRSTSIDPRLAGLAYISSPAVGSFRIDLPSSGAYTVRLAAGDTADSVGVCVELFDNTASLGVLANGAAAAGEFYDAGGVK